MGEKSCRRSCLIRANHDKEEDLLDGTLEVHNMECISIRFFLSRVFWFLIFFCLSPLFLWTDLCTPN